MDAQRDAPARAPWPDAPTYERALVVANPVAGRGKGAAVASELAEGLGRRGIATELHLTEGPGDARYRLRSSDPPPDLVVSVGGDGTLGEVLSGLVRPETPVGVLPMGTANCLGQELGLPRDVHRALEIFCGGRVRPLDVALVNDHLSFLVAGVGLDAVVVREVERRRRGPITKLAYVRAVLRVLWGYRPPALEVEVDGETLPGTYGQVLVAGARNYGGFLHLSPDARLDDGTWEVYLFPRGTRLELALHALRGWIGHLPSGAVTMRRAAAVRIRSQAPVPVQVDGDHRGETPVELRVSSTRYHLLVP